MAPRTVVSQPVDKCRVLVVSASMGGGHDGAGRELLRRLRDQGHHAQMADFLGSSCADLTPYLSGDAIKEYPNLASFATLCWKHVVFNNAIYGVPVPYPLYLWVHWVHQELLDQDGLQQPKNLDEYKSLVKHFTKPQQDLYGLATENNNGYGITNGFFTAMFGLPNLWAVDDKGKLTYSLELPAYKDAIATARVRIMERAAMISRGSAPSLRIFCS